MAGVGSFSPPLSSGVIEMLYKSPIFTAAKPTDVADEIDRLNDLYLSLFRKALRVELCIGSWGDKKFPKYGISMYWNPEEAAEAQWVLDNVKKT
jgi:hypothetical protein